MNEEEKEAIETLEDLKVYNLNKFISDKEARAIVTVIKLINKQQKEIEKLKDELKEERALNVGALETLKECVHKDTIIEKIKEAVEISETDNIRFKIETKHWYGFSEPFLGKQKHKLYLSKYSANALLETAIKIEKERIDKLIDMEIQKRNERK